jgi:hypothetical protein
MVSSRLPLVPLLRAYTRAGVPALDALGPRAQAVLAARKEFLSDAFLDTAGDEDFLRVLSRFYEAVVQPPLHGDTLRRRRGIVRHALAHLLRCPDPVSQRAERCLAADGPYSVPGLGPAFWSAVFQGLDPARHPAWTPVVETGLRRLGLAAWRYDRPGAVYAALVAAYGQILELEPALTALHVDHFLGLVAGMRNRELLPDAATPPTLDLAALVRQERGRLPLRTRLKERGRALLQARRDLEAGLAAQDVARVGAALAVADPVGGARTARRRGPADTLLLWVGRLWEADDPFEILDAFWRAEPVRGAGPWLPAAVLHLKDPHRFQPWDETSRRGYALLDDACERGEPLAESYRLFNEGAAVLRRQHRLHALEIPAVLRAVVAGGSPADPGWQAGRPPPRGEPTRFGGFCTDTFRFLEELEANNRREWMDGQRARYRFAVREPLVELCRALAERYVVPVLCRERGWDLETAACSGRALSSVCKNDYGRTVPYQTVLWITFYRRARGGKRDDVQFFVALSAHGVRCGLRLGKDAAETARLFRQHVEDHADLLYAALAARGAFAECVFGDEEGPADRRPGGPADLAAWAAGKAPIAVRTLPVDSPLLRSDELVGEILLTFDRLLPLYACAVEADPRPMLARGAGVADDGPRYTEADFRRETLLGPDWLDRARALLELKRQLILQGVPGTSKTHVARCLARLLTRGRDEAVRLVQFHPAYSYEEFVEGIKVRSVEVNGRTDVAYPVEDGVLCAFAAEAARRPAEPHVLLIDEINRGNLPRIFGELLYLLEYREQTIALPYSRRGFRLPANLYLLGTMNAADRSVALVDQALRRRFSFLEMPPDAGLLAAWLEAHPPAAGPEFAAAVVGLFERLNARLRGDLGPQGQVGHSYFMVPDLDEDRLRVVWQHHILPLLEEAFAGHAGRLGAYSLDELLRGERRRGRRRPAEVS